MTNHRRKKGDMKEGLKPLAIITQLSITMIVPILLCLFLGRFIDRRLVGGGNLWTFVFIVLGIGAAYRNTYLLIRKFSVKKGGDRNQNDE